MQWVNYSSSSVCIYFNINNFKIVEFWFCLLTMIWGIKTNLSGWEFPASYLLTQGLIAKLYLWLLINTGKGLINKQDFTGITAIKACAFCIDSEYSVEFSRTSMMCPSQTHLDKQIIIWLLRSPWTCNFNHIP